MPFVAHATYRIADLRVPSIRAYPAGRERHALTLAAILRGYNQNGGPCVRAFIRSALALMRFAAEGTVCSSKGVTQLNWFFECL